MDGTVRYWRQGLLAGLLALGLALVPMQHARAMLDAARFALDYAMPDGTLPEICFGDHLSDGGHDGHPGAPACLDCLVVTPGLVMPPQVAPERSRVATAAGFGLARADPGRQVAWTPQRARAPPVRAVA